MDKNQHDFEVVVDGTKSKLKGHLVDSTNLNLYQDIFASTEEISLAELHSISWLGIQRFYELITRFDKKICLTEIPPHIYRTILLLFKNDKKVVIKSFVVEVFNNPQEKTKILTTMEKMVEIAKSQGAFAKWDNKSKISGSLHHLCRPFFKNLDEPALNFSSKWCKNNQEICTFFYEYSCFMRVILEMCALAQQSTSHLDRRKLTTNL